MILGTRPTPLPAYARPVDCTCDGYHSDDALVDTSILDALIAQEVRSLGCPAEIRALRRIRARRGR